MGREEGREGGREEGGRAVSGELALALALGISGYQTNKWPIKLYTCTEYTGECLQQ